MNVLGIHNTGIQSAAALAVDGEIVFAIMEERLDRQKYSKHFPRQAMEACLAHAGLGLDAIDCFAVGWNPGINIASRYRAGFSEWPGYAGARLYSNPNVILPLLGGPALSGTEQSFSWENGQKTNFHYVNHHLAHAAGCFFPSGFDTAAILISDGYGERATTVWAHAQGAEIKVLRSYDFPHSLGAFYSAITEHLGYRPDHDEWKVMGAAALGDPTVFASAMHQLLALTPQGGFRLNLEYFDHGNFETQGMLRPEVESFLGPRRLRDAPLEQRHYDLAASAQAWLEQVLLASLAWLKETTGADNLCLGGGVMMNSVFNGRVAREGLFNQVSVPFAPDDAGNALGAALWASKLLGCSPSALKRPISPYLGHAFSDDAIFQTLDKYRLNYSRSPDPAAEGARLIAQGKVVGWFQGRAEFGQRALGDRSILADPRRPEMKDRLNAAVKYREAFRPFAPAILAERVSDYFDCPADAAAPFMEKVFPIRAEKRSLIPSVVHADGTGRLQTVTRAQNPLFHDLITKFDGLSGVPVVINTSFNLNGEPIVESPTDAIRTFYSSGMDALVLGSALLVK